ncbi:MAG: AzlC family ABC transporter permease [Haloferacaceae archaeon]
MSTRSSFRAGLFDGAKATAPLLPAAASIGLVTGVAATAVGLPPGQAVSMSVAFYSPIVMLTALNLLQSGAPPAVVVLGSLLVGARFAMLSLSISPYLERLSTGWRWVLAYFLLTPTYVLSVERYESRPETSRHGFYLGTAIPGWVTLQASFLFGIGFGTSVPSRWQLGFVVQLAFIALLMRFLSDRADAVAALTAGVLAVLAANFPLGTGLLVAITGGVAAGEWVRRLEVT